MPTMKWKVYQDAKAGRSYEATDEVFNRYLITSRKAGGFWLYSFGRRVECRTIGLGKKLAQMQADQAEQPVRLLS